MEEEKEFVSYLDRIKNKTKSTKNEDTKGKKIVKSTQSDIKVRDIYDGIIVVDNGSRFKQYVKILELKPITYSLRTNEDKNHIINNFSSLFTVCPTNVQIISMTLPANMKKQLDVLDQDIAEEKNEKCLGVDREYREKMLESQLYGLQKRFFIVFKYDGSASDDISLISSRMKQTENSIRGVIESCGNEVISEPSDSWKRCDEAAEILYTFYNRNEITSEPYEDKRNACYEKYLGKEDSNNLYLPITDVIAPHNVSYLDSKYVVINSNAKEDKMGTYYSFLYIPSKKYPDEVFGNWLNAFIPTFQGVDVSVFFERMDRADVMGRLRRNLTYAEANGSEAANNSALADMSSAQYSAASYLKEGLSAGLEFLYMSTLITVSGESPEEVDEKIETIKAKLKEFYVGVKECKYFEEKAFNSVLPLCNVDDSIWEKTKRNVLSDGAAMTYMFDDSAMDDANGIWFGDNADTGSLVTIDLFNTKKFNNPNVFICGQSGAGKTYALSLMAIRMRIKHIPVFIITPEKSHEFIRVCNALGGQYIEIGPGSSNIINIMEIRKRDEKASEEVYGTNGNRSYLSEKALMLKDFFKVLISDMSIEEETLLDKAIVETYLEKGITNDNESLIDPNDFLREKFREMPIISDLVEVLQRTPKAERIATVISTLCSGSARSFNGQTNVDLNNDFTVIALDTLKGNMMPLGIYMAMDFVWAKIKENTRQKKVLFIDEWWKLAFNPIAAEYSLEIAKVIRAYRGAMVIATQQMGDVLAVENGKYGQAVINNCKTKILMTMEKKDAEVVQDMIGINDTELNRVIGSPRGEGLFVSNDNNCRIKFVATNIEHELITTDGDDLEKIAQKNIAKGQKGNDGFIDFDDLFTAENDQEEVEDIFDAEE